MEKYKKIASLGEGNFGKVIHVQDVKTHQEFAMKICRIDKMPKDQVTSSLNEVKILKMMKHPYIIGYREAFIQKEKYLCIVMDLAKGGDLFSFINRQKEVNKLIPENIIMDWFIQMALGIKHIHDKKVLHRDLKTQNIFIGENREIRLGDFGVSKLLVHSYDNAETGIGTPYYLSPEICRGVPYNSKSDVWALGCILYELTTLDHAFDSKDFSGLIIKILRGKYKQIPSIYSKNLSNLICKMLDKDPKTRPSIGKILELPFLAERMRDIMSDATLVPKFSDTFKFRNLKYFSQEESKDLQIEPPAEIKQNKKRKSSISKRQIRNYIKSKKLSRRNYISKKETEQDDALKKHEEPEEVDNEDEEEGEGEGNKEVIIQQFLKNVPGTTSSDSMSYRIEALRVHLEVKLGETDFISAYRLYSNLDDEEESVQKQIYEILGTEKMKFYPLLCQLIVCSDFFYRAK
ncbi:unnamed protein product [Moneuplotes crassus]|uniref:non-specific serine/threonine protein kinase n=1 Tax=Euplotes crassus TaxID=5936 RepID=A0AAD1UFE5_EUPCR|nr:unnamed protein product [Moneuplotes crassus]